MRLFRAVSHRPRPKETQKHDGNRQTGSSENFPRVEASANLAEVPNFATLGWELDSRREPRKTRASGC